MRDVVALLPQNSGGFGLGVVGEVFGYDRSAAGLPRFDFAVAAPEPGPVRLDTGVVIFVEHGLERLASADLIHVLAWEDFDVVPDEALLAVLRSAYDRGATIASHCTGSFVLAAAGLLDRRRATTHWSSAAALAARFPAVTVDPGVLYVDEGRILTGAGTAAGVDLCLYLLRREFGAHVANAVARSMVVPPHRDGGQAQFIGSPVPQIGYSDGLGGVLEWMRAHLDAELTVDTLAARALMSPRSFTRHFTAATGSTPRAWLLAQRVQAAEELLETGDLPIEEVAHRVGFGTAAGLREQFVRRRGVPPRDYRRSFRAAPAGPVVRTPA
ncbi:MAG: helix-turn-helix domain-containing protein [Geodermatophilaceae bacterium]|nr:helix-turn-helix domain-containing protein [Geodermatophilaceae bacterium]